MNRSKVGLFILLAFIIVMPYGVLASQYASPKLSTSVVMVDTVTAVARHANGEVFFYWEGHNLLTSAGKNLIKTDLGVGGSVTAALYIAPANATFTPAVTSTQCCGGTDKSFPAGGGLNPSVGTYTSTGTGTWTVAYTFTATVGGGGSVDVFGAGLLTAATSGEIAEALFANSLSMQTSDTLTVTWSLAAS